MSKTWVVVRREYVQGVRTKGFIISTLLAPVMMGVFFVLPGLLVTLRTGEATRLAVVDLTGRLYAPLSESLASAEGAGRSEGARAEKGVRDEEFDARFHVEEVVARGDALPGVREELSRRVTSEELDAYLILPEDTLRGGAARLYARNTGDVFTHSILEDRLTRVVIEERMREARIDGERVRELSRDVEMERTRVTKEGEHRDDGGSFIFPFIIGAFIITAIMIYGQAVLSAVVEEKTTRIVEVLFSSLEAFPLLLGKLVGVSFVALTQFMIWALMFALVALYGAGAMLAAGVEISVPRVPAVALAYAPLFFLLGFYIYTTVYAVIGSIVTTEKEASQIVLPISLLPVVAIYLAFPVIRSPNSDFSFWVSLVPFFSPVTMLVRVVTETPPAWQVALSLLIGVATVLVMVWLAARIYRTGMLMYGKRPTLPEIVRWVRKA